MFQQSAVEPDLAPTTIKTAPVNLDIAALDGMSWS